MVQLVRAMGIHVILCGQRFGSDLGKHVTSIRAQVSGRICLQVNDTQTAEMVLGGLDSEVQRRALGLARPGMAIVPAGQDWLRPVLVPHHRRDPGPRGRARRQARELGRADRR